MPLGIAYLGMYKQLGTEEEEKKRMARILRVWNTEYDIGVNPWRANHYFGKDFFFVFFSIR